MPVPNQTPVNSSTGNGVTTVFPYTFKILDQADILVQVDGVTKTISTDYTVSGVGVDAGGNVTFLAAPASGALVVRSRNMDYERVDIDYQEGGAFEAETVDEDFDRAVMLLQQLAAARLRAIKAPSSVATDQALTEAMWAARASKYIGFDASGVLGVFALASAGDLSVSAFIETLLDDTDAATARGTLGAAASADPVFTGTVATLGAGMSLVFEGTTDDGFETAFVVTDPSADRTITFQNASGTVAFLSDIAAASQAEQEAGSSTSVFVTPGRQQFHPSAAKAWVQADNAGGINGSYNIASLTDGGAGLLTVTIATDFASTGYSVVGTVQTAGGSLVCCVNALTAGSFGGYASSHSDTAVDPVVWFFAAFGDQA